jgi:uncharacterized protein YndB with AHSA1/START domain
MSQRRVEALDVDAERLPSGGGFCLRALQQRRPDPGVAEFRQRDGDDADLAGPTGDVEPPDRLVVEHDHVEAGVRIVLAEVLHLSRELHVQEMRPSAHRRDAKR